MSFCAYNGTPHPAFLPAVKEAHGVRWHLVALSTHPEFCLSSLASVFDRRWGHFNSSYPIKSCHSLKSACSSPLSDVERGRNVKYAFCAIQTIEAISSINCLLFIGSLICVCGCVCVCVAVYAVWLFICVHVPVCVRMCVWMPVCSVGAILSCKLTSFLITLI